MEIAKCDSCSKEVSEVGWTYYQAWEKKKDDFGLGRKEKTFCENCWNEKEEDYRNYPLDSELLERRITKKEITKKTDSGFASFGDWICYDPTKKEWVKEKPVSIDHENKPVKKGNEKWIIWAILVVFLIALLFFIGYLWKNRKKVKKSKK